MEQISNEPFFKEVIKGIEETGEDLKQSFRELSEIAQKKIEAKTNSSKFEATYSMLVSKKQRLKTMKEVREVRSELWVNALKEAKGDVKTAYSFYKRDSSFD